MRDARNPGDTQKSEKLSRGSGAANYLGVELRAVSVAELIGEGNVEAGHRAVKQLLCHVDHAGKGAHRRAREAALPRAPPSATGH